MSNEDTSRQSRQSPTIGKLAAKLAKILGDIGKVEKTGRNDFHKYDYVTENDLVYAVRGRLSEAGLFVFESTVSQHVEVIETGLDKQSGEVKKALLTTVVTEHTFADGESGEWFTVLSQGQGSDNGDKGGYKAITGAMKYFVYKNFMIPTGDDPEGDDKTDERGVGGVAGKASTSSTSTRGTPPSGGAPAGGNRGPEVPRDVTNEMRDKFRDNKWTVVKIHFGKHNNKALAKLPPDYLEWLIGKWQPEPFNGKINENDLLLRAACDVAAEEWK